MRVGDAEFQRASTLLRERFGITEEAGERGSPVATALELKRLRAGLGLSQKQMAARIGCSRRHLEAWEQSRSPLRPSGERRQRLVEMLAMARELGILTATGPVKAPARSRRRLQYRCGGCGANLRRRDIDRTATVITGHRIITLSHTRDGERCGDVQVAEIMPPVRPERHEETGL